MPSSMKGRERAEVAERPERAIADGFAKAARLVQSAHGRVAVPWSRGKTGDTRDHRYSASVVGRGVVARRERAILMKDGRFRGRVGDSYVLLVTWDRNGKVLLAQASHQYGSATSTRRRETHYADQSPLFARRRAQPGTALARSEIESAKYAPNLDARIPGGRVKERNAGKSLNTMEEAPE